MKKFFYLCGMMLLRKHYLTVTTNDISVPNPEISPINIHAKL